MITPNRLRTLMSTTSFLYAAIGMAFLLGSCSHRYYMPNMHNVPLLREKGEARLAIATSDEGVRVNSEVKGTEIQASAAVTNHLGIMLNLAEFRATEGGDGIGHLVEVGAGRFARLGTHGVFEVYGGIGRGEVKFDHLKIPLTRVFAQPSIGYASRNFDFAVVTRFVYLRHDGPQAHESYYSTQSPEQTGLVELSGGRWMVEPGFVLRFGLRAMKVQLQYVHAENLGRPLPMFTDNVSLGIQFNINNSFPLRKRRQLN